MTLSVACQSLRGAVSLVGHHLPSIPLRVQPPHLRAPPYGSSATAWRSEEVERDSVAYGGYGAGQCHSLLPLWSGSISTPGPKGRTRMTRKLKGRSSYDRYAISSLFTPLILSLYTRRRQERGTNGESDERYAIRRVTLIPFGSFP